MRERFRIALAALLIGATCGHASAQQQDFSKVEEKVTDLGHGVYWLLGAGGNTTVAVGRDGVILVDDQFAPVSGKLMAAVATLSKAPIKYVVNTHFHGDHTGGNDAFAAAGAQIVAQDNVKTRLSEETTAGLSGRKSPPRPKAAWPTITFADSLALKVDGQTALLHHVGPAHTDGDSFVYFPEANVLAAGDCFTREGYPFLDVDNGGSFSGEIAFVDAMLAVANDTTKIVPGHGALATRTDMVAYRAMLATVRDRVAKLIAQGKTEEEAIAAKPLADLDAQWGGQLNNSDRFVGWAYRSLKGS
jgi:glyoxylase-like metal-dependent hydrolase (beta-lactamase superfamily II)